MVLQRVGVVSCGRVCGLVGTGMGLALAAFMSLLIVTTIVVGRFSSNVGTMVFAESLHTAVMLLFIPVFYGVGAFVVGTVGAFFFNLAANRAGGIEIDIVQGSD